MEKTNAYMEISTVMKQLAYYKSFAGADNTAVTDRPLAVNCTGLVRMEHAFSSDVPAGRNDYYLQYMAGGEMDVTLPAGRVVMREGDAIFYFPHTHYRYESRSGASYYWVHFSGSEAALLMRECGFENQRVMAVGVHERLRSGFERMFSDFISRDAFFELTLSTSLSKLCLDLARLHAAAAEPRPASDDRIDRVIAKIHRAYDKPLSIAALAAEEFLSESRLRVLFRQRTGMSPHAYMTALRVSTAKQLLESSAVSVGEAAKAVGFDDALYFSKVFKQVVGVSPSEYRSL